MKTLETGTGPALRFKCDVCFKNKQLAKFFSTQSILNKHLREAHGPRRFQCQVCFKAFNGSVFLQRHERTHLQNIVREHKCEHCSKTFDCPSNLRDHLFGVHGRKIDGLEYFKCGLCAQEFVYRSQLEKHVVNKHVVDMEFKCTVCRKKFIDKEAQAEHERCHKVEHLCDVCSDKFIDRRSLTIHLGVEHNRFYRCDKKCFRSYGNKSEFDQHFLAPTTNASKVKLKCLICSQILDSECLLNIHSNAHNNNLKNNQNSRKIRMKTKQQHSKRNGTFKCPVCSSIFPSKSLLDTHTNSHPEVKTKTNQEAIKTNGPTDPENEQKPELESIQKLNLEFKCKLCSKTLSSPAYMEAHRRQFHADHVYKCEIEECSAKFKTQGQLTQHQKRGHLETKSFVCSDCPKSYFRIYDLKRHQRSHHSQ